MKKMVLGVVSTALAFGMLTACGNVNEPNDPILDEELPTEDPYVEDGLDDNLGEEDINEGVDPQGFRGGSRRGNLDPHNIDRERMNDYYRN
ncbi:hypothetical protein AJ85_13955 [Alkalihalobacillus alcalophilus ATCC 27647 = CGMCC 1.3604]|uniref:Lipoprotein n=1 Tax=Alkalihalobacillus alcalophilus ATCC 27647 = CGMCC 1.3604 TaxID=1218173 RepID=A0A094WF67_ALKAL|nr:hypothetical protein [Alkalihalobacillus alcalophilus]KGA96399.1 hypothetical protein BALCAV_0216510 [Alkalihalobacillus alcalophilus ATCC 27647 = CGMCC 1.3604]MED1563224.1 hypothetical protein [Alkalihalobacillus alcalophilus]THG89994.1 hypothetical protein AJ85_13955 [Alkalihalobacillus alcalophilus ATCC 27647 = CGMCC 1.3604]